MSSSPRLTSREDVRRARVEFNFRQKYGDAGFDKLMAAANNYELTNSIAEKFGISRARISHILSTLLGMPYHQWLAQHGVRRKKVTPPEASE